MRQRSTARQGWSLQELPQRNTSAGEPGVGVVRPQGHAELHAAGEHAVGLAGAQRGEVIDQHTHVALGAADGERGLAINPQTRIDPSNHTLRRQNKPNTSIGLFVAKTSAHLPPQAHMSNHAQENATACASNPGSFLLVAVWVSEGLLGPC